MQSIIKLRAPHCAFCTLGYVLLFGLQSFLFSSLLPLPGVFPLFIYLFICLLVKVGLRAQNAIWNFRAPHDHKHLHNNFFSCCLPFTAFELLWQSLIIFLGMRFFILLLAFSCFNFKPLMPCNTGVSQTNRPTNQKGSNIDQQLIHHT